MSMRNHGLPLNSFLYAFTVYTFFLLCICNLNRMAEKSKVLFINAIYYHFHSLTFLYLSMAIVLCKHDITQVCKHDITQGITSMIREYGCLYYLICLVQLS